MMGVTMTVAITIWLAGSYLEYKVVTGMPFLKPIFRGLPGVLISVALGALVAFTLSAPSGAGVMLGQLLGLATNEFTFKFYTKLHQLNERRIVRTEQLQTYKAEHPATFEHVTGTMRGGLKTIGYAALGVVYLCGLPHRMYCKGRDVVRRVRPA